MPYKHPFTKNRRHSITRDRASSRTRRQKLFRQPTVERLERRSLLATLNTFLTTEHTEPVLGYNAGTWTLQIGDADNALRHDTEDALFYAGAPSLTSRPAGSAFDFIGVAAGQDFHRLPQSQDPELLYLGFAAYDAILGAFDRYNPSMESKGRVSGNGRWLKVSHLDVQHTTPSGEAGDGKFSLWQSGDTAPTVFMSNYNDGVSNPNGNGLDTTDGISTDDALWITAGGHLHYNWGFTQKGRYEVTVKLSGYLGDGGVNNGTIEGTYSESQPFTFYVSVGSVGQLEFDAPTYTVNEGAGTASVTVRRVNGSDGRITVNYATSNGTATAGSDYTAPSGTLTFNDQETSQVITVPILDDTADEPDETVNLTLNTPGPSSINDYLIDIEGDANGLLGGQASATLTIAVNTDNNAPAAVDDAYVVGDGSTVYGNVLFNDSDVDGDGLTASMAILPAAGTVTLNPNGSFTYTPNLGFTGADSFAYTANDGNGGTDNATVTITAAVPQDFLAVLTTGHADVGIAYEGGEWDLHVHDEEHDAEYEPDEALLYVGPQAEATRPMDSAFNFIGVGAGETYWRLPDTENPELLFLGIGAEEIEDGTFQGGQVQLRLKGVNGPGHFSLWQSTDDGPAVAMATSDGITAADFATILEGGHEHVNFGFTALGGYEVTFEAVGTLPDGTPVASGDVTYFFQVNAAPVNDAQIIDNSDLTGFQTSGQWASGAGPGVGRADNIRLAYGESFLPTDVTTWTFNLPDGPGRYRVSGTWFTNPMFPGLFTDRARFEIADSDVGAVRGTAIVNQKQVPDDFSDAGSDWEEFGTFEMVGSTLTVRLFSSGDNATYVVADAIRIERIGDLSTGTEIQVTMAGEAGQDVVDGTGNADFGTTDFGDPVIKTFVISNTGAQPLSLTGPISVTGNVFEVVSQPPVSVLNPGQSTSFQVRMTGWLTGPQSATVSFGNSDSDEGLFDFTVSGTVRTTKIIDDGDSVSFGDPGFFMFPTPGEPGGWGQVGGPGRDFDFKFNRSNPGGFGEFAIWTFNVTPGQYRVSTTWAFGSQFYEDSVPFTIFDGDLGGGAFVGGRNVNQQVDPDDTDYATGFMFPLGTSGSQNWERIDVVNIDSDTLTVLLRADDPLLFALADSVLIDRLGDVPAGPEVVVAEGERIASGTVEYGQTQLGQFVDRLFTIRNTGTTTLNITSPITIGGANSEAFTLQSGPSTTAIAPGGFSTFVVRMNANYDGTKNATISFTTNDADETSVVLPIAGNVTPYRIIDDLDVSYSPAGMTHQPNIGIAYRNDFSLANTPAIQGPASATWTFDNVSPGTYYVALTWIDAAGNDLWADNTQVIIRDGGAEVANLRVNQRHGPSGPLSFSFDDAQWQILSFFMVASSTVTVTVTNDSANGLIIADGALLNRTGGVIPPGNSEPDDSAAASSMAAASSGGGTLRSEPGGTAAIDDGLLNTAYLDGELEEVATLLAEDAIIRDEQSHDAPISRAGELQPDELEVDFADWL